MTVCSRNLTNWITVLGLALAGHLHAAELARPGRGS